MKFVAFCGILFFDEISLCDFFLFGRYEMSLQDFMLLQHDFRTRYPDEISCFLGPSGDLRMRFYAFLAFMRFLYEIYYTWWWLGAKV
jgi:hypothetical protein